MERVVQPVALDHLEGVLMELAELEERKVITVTDADLTATPTAADWSELEATTAAEDQ